MNNFLRLKFSFYFERNMKTDIFKLKSLLLKKYNCAFYLEVLYVFCVFFFLVLFRSDCLFNSLCTQYNLLKGHRQHFWTAQQIEFQASDILKRKTTITIFWKVEIACKQGFCGFDYRSKAEFIIKMATEAIKLQNTTFTVPPPSRTIIMSRSYKVFSSVNQWLNQIWFNNWITNRDNWERP